MVANACARLLSASVIFSLLVAGGFFLQKLRQLKIIPPSCDGVELEYGLRWLILKEDYLAHRGATIMVGRVWGTRRGQ